MDLLRDVVEAGRQGKMIECLKLVSGKGTLTEWSWVSHASREPSQRTLRAIWRPEVVRPRRLISCYPKLLVRKPLIVGGHLTSRLGTAEMSPPATVFMGRLSADKSQCGGFAIKCRSPVKCDTVCSRLPHH